MNYFQSDNHSSTFSLHISHVSSYTNTSLIVFIFPHKYAVPIPAAISEVPFLHLSPCNFFINTRNSQQKYSRKPQILINRHQQICWPFINFYFSSTTKHTCWACLLPLSSTPTKVTSLPSISSDKWIYSLKAFKKVK